MVTSRQRLERYRVEAESIECSPPLTWRDVMLHHKSVWQVPGSIRGADGRIFSEALTQYGRHVTPAYAVLQSGETIYYADSTLKDGITAYVLRLRCPRGTLYVPVTGGAEWCGTTHYLNKYRLVGKGASSDEHEDAARQCAIDAMRCAEAEAEEALETEARTLAVQKICEAREGIHAVSRVARPLLRALRSGTSDTRARQTLAECLEARRSLFAKITRLRENYWLSIAD